MKRLVGLVFVLYIGSMSTSANAGDSPGAWLILRSGAENFIFPDNRSEISSMKQCVKVLRGMGRWWAAEGNKVKLYADGSEIPNWIELDNKVFREWAERSDHVVAHWSDPKGAVFVWNVQCIRAE